jgi:MFS family permease
MFMINSYLEKLRLLNRNARLYLFSWAIIGFCHMGMIMVLFNLYLLRLGHGPELVGIVSGSYWIVYSVTCLLVGLLGRHWSHRTLLIAGMAIITGGWLLVLATESLPWDWQVPWITITYSISWIGAAMYMSVGEPFLASVTTGEERNHAFAVRAAINNVFGFTGSLVAGILPGFFAGLLHSSLDEPTPYRYPFWMATALYGLTIFILLTTRETPDASPPEGKINPNSPVKEKQSTPIGLIFLVACVTLLVNGGTASINNYFNVYLDTELAVSTVFIGTLSAAKQLLSVLFALVAPVLVTRWGNNRTIIFSFLMRGLSMLPIALIPHWLGAGIGYIGAVSIASITLPTFGVYQQEVVTPRWRSAMTSAVNAATGLSGALMAYAGIYMISTWGYSQLFLLSAGLVALGAFLFWGINTRTQKLQSG